MYHMRKQAALIKAHYELRGPSMDRSCPLILDASCICSLLFVYLAKQDTNTACEAICSRLFRCILERRIIDTDIK